MENVATAIVLTVIDDRAPGQIYNVGERETLSEIQWIKAIGGIAGWKGEVVTVAKDRLPEHLVPDYNRDQHLVVGTTKKWQELGYEELVSRDAALQQTVAWERTHPQEEIDTKIFDYLAEDALLTELGLHGI